MSDPDYEVRLKNTGRNDRCPCGSGKKYKKCHSTEDQAARNAALKALEEEAEARTAAKAEEDDDGESDASEIDRNKRVAARHKGQTSANAQPSGGKSKNIPRRGAV